MTTTTPPLAPADNAVLAVRQALAVLRTTTAPTIDRIAAETTAMRSTELAAFVDEIDATLGRIAEVLTHTDNGITDRLPDGQALIDDALAGLERTGAALEHIHTGLISR
jgi:ABC-type transporter Mla subunit MlaD